MPRPVPSVHGRDSDDFVFAAQARQRLRRIFTNPALKVQTQLMKMLLEVRSELFRQEARGAPVFQKQVFFSQAF